MRPPSPKQLAEAEELLLAGRVRVVRAAAGRYLAEVQGSEVYRVEKRDGEFVCTCPLADYRPSWTCKHIAALQFVTGDRQGGETHE